MVKILKTPLPKHEETLSPWIKEFVQVASTTSLSRIRKQLATFPSRWPFPRDDLYHWIPLLNRFDSILEDFCQVYGLHDGPQTRDFTCELLERDLQGPDTLEELGYGKEGDREVIEAILNFTRILLENCGNRTIYASSPLLSDLLNSTSLSLIASTLQIGSQLAQRYQASFKRISGPYRQHNNSLLAVHYNINLDRVQQLAQPFVRTIVSADAVAPTTPVTPSSKGKEKAYFSTPTSSKTSVATYYANDLVSIATGVPTSSTGANGNQPAKFSPQVDQDWNGWGDIRITYYDTQSQSQDASVGQPSSTSASVPSTPTPIRRSSTIGHQHGQRSSRLSNAEDSSPQTARAAVISAEDSQSSKLKVVEIANSKIATTPIHDLLKEYLPSLPKDSKYELLAKLRVEKALTSSVEERRQMLAVRILSLTNLAYIHAESTFLEKVLKQDSDEPRRLQLIYQLADMIHPPADGQDGVPPSLQTIALAGLKALAVYPSKYQDICTALNTNINHGVLLYIVRKAVAEMETDEPGDKLTEKDEWRGAVFSLLSDVATLPRAGSEMVTAGLVPILIDVLKLRTSVAERNYPMILDFLDAFIFNVRDAFGILVGADGLDAISDLIIHEVKSASEAAKTGYGMQPSYRSPSIDYEIPFFQQQSIKWLFKFIHHMMTTAGGYGGNFDRLLRNLIDSTQLLASLKDIIGNSQRFGSTVWTNAVRILNDFINNEPTSFAVIAEAGLSRQFLEAITGREIKMPEEPQVSQTQTEATNDASSAAHTDDEDDEDSTVSVPAMIDDNPHPPTEEMLEAPRDGPLAHGIMPSAEAITIIPAAFGAICLNSSGMRMFQASNALQSFFEVFESPKHVQCMENDSNLASNLGATFDELVRHHPPLKTAILNATLDMVAKVAHLCKKMASNPSIGAKLLTTDTNGLAVVADHSLVSALTASSLQSKGKERATTPDEDVEMSGIDNDAASSEQNQPSTEKFADVGPTAYVFVVATFLSTMFSNSTIRVAFMEKGGSDYVLDLAELPSLPIAFADDKASGILHQVISLLAEEKPHLISPSLLKRAQSAADILIPFSQHKGSDAYFTPFISGESIDTADQATVERVADGTQLAKAFVNLHSLTKALQQCFQTPLYTHRTSVHSFHQINLSDYYMQFVKSLGPLLAAITREAFFLSRGNLVPPHWKQATRVKDAGRSLNSDLSDAIMRLEPVDATGPGDTLAGAVTAAIEGVSTNNITTQSGEGPTSPGVETQVVTKKERESSQFKNYKALRYLLAKLPPTINAFLQGLGKIIITKRISEPYQRQSNVAIADAIAETILFQLSPVRSEATLENYNYWIVMLETVKDILISVNRNGERQFEIITGVLQAFKDRGGFEILNQLLNNFADDIRKHAGQSKTEKEKMPAGELLKQDLKSKIPALGIKHILTVYLLLVTGKNINEASQTAVLSSRSERHGSRNEPFSAAQLIVELRMAVLPVVRRLWESDLVEKANHSIPNRLIDIIRVIAAADLEHGAHKRSDNFQAPTKAPRKPWKANVEHLTKLTEASFSEDLAKEALFRCQNNYATALEYCRAQKSDLSGGRNPIPKDEIDLAAEVNGSSAAHTGPSTGTSTPLITEISPRDTEQAVIQAPAVVGVADQIMGPPPPPNDPMAMSVDSLLNGINTTLTEAGGFMPTPSPTTQLSTTANSGSHAKVITVDDLNEERAAIREQLVARCLDVINAHGEVTFEISDLITTVVDKSEDPANMRKDMGETLVEALMSFAMEDDIREVGKKIAAYAHLLALILQNKNFYNACVGSLKEHLPTLLEFVKLSPTHSSEESSPWIAPVLLIVEILLSEDAQPYETDWKFPTAESTVIDKPVLKETEPVVSPIERNVLFNHILDILPRIGKDESLALAVLRILVILTRTRGIALSMGERKNIQRLFVMAKQMAGASSVRLQGPLMMILRHIIEDDETIKQTMRSEIKAFFDVPRTQRHIDISTYLRQLSNLVIRAPVLFVEVTNEMVKLTKWSSNSESPGRQQIVLQEPYQRSSRSPAENTLLPPLQGTGLLSLTEVKQTTEAAETESAETAKQAQVDHKTPVVENPDGVIHFLLCELLNYKDVEDKDSAVQLPEQTSETGPMDTAMADAGSPPKPADAKDTKKSSKQEFKAEEHPIYIYRCFLMQCLTELLSCYNRTKIEFINFKRSAPPQAIMTPSKPRSSVVNYLLFDLIPIGTLEHAETTPLRKKMTTSSWADSVICALLCKTGEQIMDKDRDATDSEDEPDLLFVRKFILENILRAYKEASTSNEAFDIKYARMLSLADLMSHVMVTKEDNSNATDPAVSQRSGLQLRRIMFEKGFIGALTSSLADIDLNFPGAKRAAKHILRPLKTLTQTAIDLSDAGKVTLPAGQIEGDDIDIASASSVSELEEEREETPDLFRNSTLGMFEPGRDEDSSSDSEDDDEEMYEGEFDEEGLGYEEEMEEGDDEDNISDEDVELEGIGHIEGLSGDHTVDVEVIMEEGDDEDDDDEPSDEDDEDEDSDDMDEDEGEARVEFVDEDGDPIPLVEGDDGDEWQSEDDDNNEEDEEEEEDYEGRAADEEEERQHEAHIAHGAIGHLVRAFGGDDHQGAVEILQRMEEEGIDEGQMELEGYMEDGQDDEDDEEDEEDMDDDDEAMYDDYPGPPPGPMAFEWNSDAVDPPLPVIISHRGHHRPRHGIPSPFGYFPTGGREPLGGMLNPLPSFEVLDRETLAPPRFPHVPVAAMPRVVRRGGLTDDEIVDALSARSALEEARQRLLALEALFSGIVNRTPASFSTNTPSVPEVYRGFSPYRSHRPGPTPRGNDDGLNPLLQRNLGSNPARDGFTRSGQIGGPLATLRPGDGLPNINIADPASFGDGPAALLNDLISSLPLPGNMGNIITRNGASMHFHITGGGRGEMTRDLQALFGMTRGLTARLDNRRETLPEPGIATVFNIRSTAGRWTDEAKLLFGNAHSEKAYTKILNAVMAVLIPPALKSEMEARKLAEEMKKRRDEEERLAKEAEEKRKAEEKAAKEKKEAEEREAAERARAEAAAAAEVTLAGDAPTVVVDGSIVQAMEGVETAEGNTASAPAEDGAEAADRPRVTTVIRGNQIDITDLGIDADFLGELPDDIREEVITSAIAERRSAAAATGAEPSEIDQEFLDALPAEIRDEIIQQERQDRRRREREEARRQAAANGTAAPSAAPQDMDAASILATMPPALRQQVLMEQDDEVLEHLPAEFVAQARAAMRDLPLSHVRNGGRPRTIPAVGGEVSVQKLQKRSTVQMLDKAGVATLLRLMFVFQQDSLRQTLFNVLQNISENRLNRSEVISTLLHILQDGSTDMTAVERSFAHLSLRAKQPKGQDPKTPQPLKRTSTGTGLNMITNTDVSPLMVVQQCLNALIYLSKVNFHVPSFFLTEHDPGSGLKRSASKKGKGKETKAAKYALNSLLTLLDRQLIMESSSIMELLSDLLSRVTAPLQALERKQKEAEAAAEAKKVDAEPGAAETAPSVVSPETTVTNDQPSDSMDTDTATGTEPTAGSAIEPSNVPAPDPEQTEQPTVSAVKDNEQKKQKPFLPPVIPEANLKLVINIFVARECSAKTFRETLTTIKNLSCIPGAKVIFGKELIRKAHELGEVILLDLDDLLPQIQKASTGTELQGVALAKFSPSGSDQNKLLRVLTALDHLFEPKNGQKKEIQDEEGTGESSKDIEKQNLLAALYENSTFSPMWEKLSSCLSAIRQRENMLNVATILLPLIESLMVVCKNTTLKDTPISRSQIVTSPPPESRTENLFFNFTEEHRKILNDLVRHTPKLMSGTFSLLVKNPKVLEFDNKRNYFTRSIHNRNSQARQTFPPLQLQVRRDQVFHDSYRSLYFKTGDEMKFGKLSIRFHGEEGVDAGGVTREWFQVLSRQMFDPGYALFIPVSSDRTTFHPNHMSSVNPEHLLFFKFIGRVIGKALFEGRVLDCHFSRAVYKRILGKSVSVKDMESLDPEYYKSLIWMLENDITDVIAETFSVDNDKFGSLETVDLIENGRNVLVTEENKHEYVRLIVEFKLIGSVKEQLDDFLLGFHEIIPAELVAIFNEQELELLISGLPEIDVDDWKSNTEYHNYTGASPQIQWFWRAIRSFDKEERAKLLQFVTGTSKVPLNGFKELEGMNGFSRFNIHRDYGNKDRLPSSHTCFNQLDLPEYESYETLRQQLLTAITAGSEYFGFA